MLDIKEIQTIEHDVIVVGAGGAGIRAAIECAHSGMNVGMISKSHGVPDSVARPVWLTTNAGGG